MSIDRMGHVIVGSGHFLEGAAHIVQNAPRIIDNISRGLDELQRFSAASSHVTVGSRATGDISGLARTRMGYRYPGIHADIESTAWETREREYRENFLDHLKEEAKEAALAVGSTLSGDYAGACEHTVNFAVEFAKQQLDTVQHTIEWWESLFRAGGATEQQAEDRAARMVRETIIQRPGDGR